MSLLDAPLIKDDTTQTVAPSAATGRKARLLVLLFGLTSFVGSGMLFLIQPLVGRQLLPLAGGTPSLWNTAMVFFQAVLLLGYLYAHWNARKLKSRLREPVHLLVLALPLAVLPVTAPTDWNLSEGNPVWSTLGVLGLMVGLPFFALSTASPTLQAWFSRTSHESADDPYFLYATGNVGSLLALVAYPFLIEPTFALDTQAKLWAGIYIVFLALTAACALVVRSSATTDSTSTTAFGNGTEASIAWATRGRWVFWAAIPSALMLGVTRHITTDIASFPLLWIIPLILYLASFIIAFGARSERLTKPVAWALRLLVTPVALSSLVALTNSLVLVSLHLIWFFLAALLGHLRLSTDRPPAFKLTEFYAWVSLGGVVGGGLTALVAPMVFNNIYEYPIIAVLALAMLPVSQKPFRSLTWGLVVPCLAAGIYLQVADEIGLAVMLYLIAGVVAAVKFGRPSDLAIVVGVSLVAVLAPSSTGALHGSRSFFGVYQVRESQDEASGRTEHQLFMGTTVHGAQEFTSDGTPLTDPDSYYHPSGPLGAPFAALGENSDVAVVGLGGGAIAGYGKPGDRYTFYEIDPEVIDIALNDALFTYLRDTDAEIELIVGDGRLELAKTADRYDLLVVDAFNSDAIPVHLVTVQAFETYLTTLAPGGVLMMHISNRHFDLQPAIATIGQEIGFHTLVRHYTEAEAFQGGGTEAIWVAMSYDAAALQQLDSGWYSPEASGPLWTDDHANILSALRRN